MDVSVLFIILSAGPVHYQYCLLNSQDVTVVYFMMLYFATPHCR